MLLCHTCIYMHPWVCRRMHTVTHKNTNTQTRLPFLQPSMLQSRRHRPSPSLVQTCTTKKKKKEGPNPAAPWSRQKPTGEWEKQAEGRKARRQLHHSPSGSELWTEERCSSSKRLSELCEASESRFSWSEPGCSISGSRQARSSLWRSRWRQKDCERMLPCDENRTIIRGAFLLLLFDGLDAFHQVFLSLCVWVQRLVLRDHAQLRTGLLVHLQEAQHLTVTLQPT